ncbi:3D domain-containing protein [Eubacterium sp.]|uniref:3D domain-containing protein n=1 Tax=Eubacterium sp. TaxID=142586 RepID=UPI003995F604
MKKTKLIAGSLILSVTLCIAVAASLLIVDRFSAGNVNKDVTTISKTANNETILKSSNDFQKLTKSASFINTNDVVSIKTEEKENTVLIEKNRKVKKTAAKSAKKNKKASKTKYKKIGTFKITGYCGCSSCCGKTTGITASGTKATAGRTIAADTSKLPFGTKVVINGHTYTVEDRGGAIRGNRIDVFFSSHAKALEWGVRYCDVYTVR